MTALHPPSSKARILITGPPASGKTERLLNAGLIQWLSAGDGTGRLRPASDVLILTSVREEQDRLRRILIERLGGVWGAEFATFENLSHLLLKSGRIAPQLGAVRRRVIWEEVIEASCSELRLLGPSSRHPNFPAHLERLVRELENARRSPADLLSLAVAAREDRLSDLALLWKRFHERVEREWGWTEKHLELYLTDKTARRDHPFRYLAVSGFADLSPLRRAVIQELADACEAALLTLPDGEGTDAGIDPAWAAPRQSIRFFEENGWTRERTSLPSETSCPGLSLLTKTTSFPTDHVQIIEGRNPLDELQRALRLLKRRVREESIPWEECAILLRNASSERPVVEALLRRMDIPFQSRIDRSLSESRLHRLTLAGLTLAAGRWSRPEVLLLLKTLAAGENTTLTPGDVDLLEAEIHQKGIDQTLRAFLREKGVTLLDPIASASSLSSLRPPDFLALLDQMGLLRLTGEDPFERRAWERLGALAEALPRAKLSRYRRFVEILGQEQTIQTGARGRKGVWVSPIHAALGERFSLVLVPRLNEDHFPARVPVEGFLADGDRKRLDESLPTLAAREGMERALTWEAFTRSTDQLILSFSRADARGNPLNPSLYLRELEERIGEEAYRALCAVSPDETGRALHLPTVEEAVDREELAAAVTRQAARPRFESSSFSSEEAAVTRALAAGLGIERLLLDLHGAKGPEKKRDYARPPLRLESEEDRRFVWSEETTSISRLEMYQACPYRYFCRYVLGLREWTDPADEGEESRLTGTLTHEVLREFFTLHPRLAPEEFENYLAEMGTILERIIKRQAGELQEASRIRIARSLLNDLRSYLQTELRRHPDWHPVQLESAFGEEDSEYPALELRAADLTVRLAGRIDRIDVGPGNEAVVVDYKRRVGSDQAGALRRVESLQLPVYIKAAREYMGVDVKGAVLVSTRGSSDTGAGEWRGYAPDNYAGRRGYPVWGSDKDMEEHLERVAQHVLELVRAIRLGGFPRDPGHCSKKGHCAYPDLCRLGDWEGESNEGEGAEE